VATLARDKGFEFHSIKFDTSAYTNAHGVSIQMAARQLRYEWFNELRQRHEYDYLVTAHHLNDNLETAILNLTRGTGIAGLRGMRSIASSIIRPLMSFTRLEIEAYAKKRKLNWREDASNVSDDYQRNFLRHKVIPLLKEINPSLENTFYNNSKRLLGEEELLDFAIQQIKSKYTSQQSDQLKIEKAVFKLFENKSGVLLKLIGTFGFNLTQCEEVVGHLTGQSGTIFRANNYELVVDREVLIVSERKMNPLTLTVEEKDEVLFTNNFSITITMDSATNFIKNNDPLNAQLDKDKLKFPLVIRSWQSGDFFYPLGMKHKKKLSDFLIDCKVSMADKNHILVMETEGKIVWLIGHRIDDRFKITPDTKTVISFNINPRIS
jgi:tRNA(Ile)-lysidine synthase